MSSTDSQLQSNLQLDDHLSVDIICCDNRLQVADMQKKLEALQPQLKVAQEENEKMMKVSNCVFVHLCLSIWPILILYRWREQKKKAFGSVYVSIFSWCILYM